MKLIDRPHLLQFLGGFFADGNSIVVLTGKLGTGKSVLARQYCATHVGPVLTLAIGSDNRWARDPASLTESLVAQIHAVFGDPPSVEVDDESIDHEYFQLVHRLGRFARQRGETVLLAIDGLESIPEENLAERAELFRLIPLGKEGFRFLFSGLTNRGTLPPSAISKSTEYLPPPFSLDETKALLAPFQRSDADIATVVRIARGFPEKLAAIYRILERSNATDSGLSTLPDSQEELHQLEWEMNLPLTDSQRLALAVMIEEPAFATIDTLSAVAGAAASDLEQIRDLSFVNGTSTPLSFATAAIGAFVAKQLDSVRETAIDACVKYLTAQPDQDRSLSRITTILARGHRSANLLSLLSDEKFAQFAGTSGSLTDVKLMSERGILAALDQQSPADALRFSLQRGSLSSYVASKVPIAELRALVALNDVIGATTKAEAERLVEARFRGLCAVARACKEFHGAVPSDVDSAVRSAFIDLPAKAFGDEALGVATDLLFVAPELATSLLADKASHVSTENRLDVAFAMLAFESLAAGLTENSASTIQSIESRVDNPRVRSLLTAAAMSTAGVSATTVIEQAAKIPLIADRVFVLESWMLANRERGDSLQVLEYALKTCVVSAGYTASARTYRRLTRCLLFNPTIQQLAYFVRLVDAQLSNLERIGPQHEFHRLLIQLARAEWRFDRSTGRERFIAAYVTISDTREPLDRAAGLARLLATIAQVDPELSLNHGDQLHTIVARDLDVEIDRLLSGTAEHLETLKEVVIALSISLPDRAIALCGRLNLVSRRDRAYAEFVASHLRGTTARWSLDLVRRAVLAIDNPMRRDEVLEDVANAIQLRGLGADPVATGNLVVEIASLAPNPFVRATTIARVASVLAGRQHIAHAATLARLAAKEAGLVQDPSDRRVAALEIASLAASFDREWAVARINDPATSTLATDDTDAQTATILGLKLAIRAVPGLVRAGALHEKLTSRLIDEIERQPSAGVQVDLLSQLTTSFVLGKASPDIVERTRDLLLRKLALIPAEDARERTIALVQAAPALHAANAGALLDGFLQEMSGNFRDLALHKICRFVRLIVPVDDPFEEVPGSEVALTHAQALTLVELAQRFSSDGSTFTVLEQVISGIDVPASRETLSGAQRAEVVERIERASARCFPSAQNIKHEGYAICVDALLDDRLRPKTRRKGYASLAARAKALPNAADAALVLAYVATYAATSNPTNAIEEARKAAIALPYLGDRIDRLETLARLIVPVDKGRSKVILKESLGLAREGEGETFEERRRSIISLAHRLDPAFGNSLAVLSDDDPAKLRLEEARRMDGLRRRFRDKEFVAVCAANGRDLSRVAWDLLGSLHANRTKPAQSQFLLAAIERAAREHFDLAYPILALAIQSEVKRSQTKATVALEVLLPLFEAALRAAATGRDALSRVAHRARARSLVHRASESLEIGEVKLISGPTGHDAARQFLREWLLATRPATLLISDPYFDVALLKLLSMLKECELDPAVTIVTSKHSLREEFGPDYEEHVRDEWWKISADAPPSTAIVAASFRAREQSPIHDRWWLAANAGLQFGSSAGGMGGRLTSIREMQPTEVEEVRARLAAFADRSLKFLDGEPVGYSLFTL